jgi:hypothetical protein
MKTLQFFFILILCAIQFQCIHYFAKDTSEFNLTDEETKILQSKKFGLVGFRPICIKTESFWENKYSIHENLIRLIRFLENSEKSSDPVIINRDFLIQKRLASRNKKEYRIREYLSNTKTSDKFFPSENNILAINRFDIAMNEISNENLKAFLKTYFNKVNHLGIEEIMSLVDFSDPNKIQLRKNSFDYWIIGFHSPDKIHKSSLTDFAGFLSFLTLGIIPFYGKEDISSDYWIFDSKLNLIQAIPISQTKSYAIASWFFWRLDDDPFYPVIPIEVYESDIKQFTKELAKVVAK